jgi:hypothetical protein
MIKGFASAVISMALVFQGINITQPAQAASCSSVGGQAGRLKHSGLVSGNAAKVCGREIWKLVGAPKPLKKPVVHKSPAKKVHWKNEFSVTPDRPRLAVAGETNLSVGHSVLLSSLAKKHQRNRMLLWYPTQVRFKPLKTTWNFGDGETSAAPVVAHSWSKPGFYEVTLAVEYSVKYRIVGKSDWVLLPGTVRGVSTPRTFHVGEATRQTDSRVTLVHWNCIQKLSAFGC